MRPTFVIDLGLVAAALADHSCAGAEAPASRRRSSRGRSCRRSWAPSLTCRRAFAGWSTTIRASPTGARGAAHRVARRVNRGAGAGPRSPAASRQIARGRARRARRCGCAWRIGQLDDGTGVIKEARGRHRTRREGADRRRLGLGQSTLVRAIAGLWPWGERRVVMQRDLQMFMLPQQPMCRSARCRRNRLLRSDRRIREGRGALEAALESRRARTPAGPSSTTEPVGPRPSSGSEKQRLAFARLHHPQAQPHRAGRGDQRRSTRKSQERLLRLHQRAASRRRRLISVGHRPSSRPITSASWS